MFKKFFKWIQSWVIGIKNFRTADTVNRIRANIAYDENMDNDANSIPHYTKIKRINNSVNLLFMASIIMYFIYSGLYISNII